MNEYNFIELTFSYKESKCLVQSIDKHKSITEYFVGNNQNVMWGYIAGVDWVGLGGLVWVYNIFFCSEDNPPYSFNGQCVSA